MSDTITLPARPDVEREERTRRQPPYNVILLDDDHHTFDYVIRMLHQLFGHPPERGHQIGVRGERNGPRDRADDHQGTCRTEAGADPRLRGRPPQQGKAPAR